MDIRDAVQLLAALGQSTRLEAVRLMVRAEPAGIRASDIAAALDVPRNTMSNHLNILTAAGLISFRKDGRQMIYRADLERLGDLGRFLVEECCGGHPELCAPAIGKICGAKEIPQ